MDMQGNRQLAITQQQTWDALNDPAVLKACIPGCDKVEAIGENQFSIGMSLKIGPVSAKFTGKITLSDIVPPQSYTISFEGQGGPAGFGKGHASVKLTPNAGGNELSYTVNASVGGKIAQMGQRLIDGVAKSMAEDFFKRFDEHMQKQYPEAYASQAQADAVTDQPTTESEAPASAGGLMGLPTWAWVAGAAIIVAVIALAR
jgi:carbon monoxide dehydrogenase subunit G